MALTYSNAKMTNFFLPKGWGGLPRRKWGEGYKN